jgi:hypothetical protein
LKTSTALLFATLAAIATFTATAIFTDAGYIAGHAPIALSAVAMVTLAACAVLSNRLGD